MFTSQNERLMTRPLCFCNNSSLKSGVTAKVNGGVYESVTGRPPSHRHRTVRSSNKPCLSPLADGVVTCSENQGVIKKVGL
jgi:hypothetical protein